MLPGMELIGCHIDVPAAVMHHVVKVESSYNPYAIGVVGGHLVRQPRNLAEAIATAEMLEARGMNFSLGLSQVNRYNLKKYGLNTYRAAFAPCGNLLAGSRILKECHVRAEGSWSKAFSCYYSGNFTTGFRHGYVKKVRNSMLAMRGPETPSLAIPVVVTRRATTTSSKNSAANPSVSTSPSRIVSRTSQSESTMTLAQRRSQPVMASAQPSVPLDMPATVAEARLTQPMASGAVSNVATATAAVPVSTNNPVSRAPAAGDAAFVF